MCIIIFQFCYNEQEVYHENTGNELLYALRYEADPQISEE